MEQAKRLRVLWVTPKWLFPANDGARIASTQLLRQLRSKPIEIDLCSIVQEGDPVDLEHAKSDLGVERVNLVWRSGNQGLSQKFLNFLQNPFYPITLAPYATKEVAEQMKALLRDKRYDLIVFDGLHASAWRDLSDSGEAEIAYRAHNVESELWFQAAKEATNPLKKIILVAQGKLVKKIETELASDSHYLFPVSLNDEEKFKNYPLQGKIKTLPIGIQIASDQEPKSAPNTRKLLFVGRLDWPPNRDGLSWVLKNVWAQVYEKNPDLELTIVGSGNSSWLRSYGMFPGVKVEGAVKDLAPYYEDCVATLVPVFYGSGTRVKAIESSLYGRACISTAIGVEGMGLSPNEHYYPAETVEEWVRCLSSLTPNHALEVGRRAKAHAKQLFNPESIASQFVDSISGKNEASLDV